MKIIDTIKKKYFPHKVKLVAGEERAYLTDLDKAFIYACQKLELYNNRLGWFSPEINVSWRTNYEPNKYDFFKFNVEVQYKCWETGHLREIFFQMTYNLTNPKYWKPFFKLMEIFNYKEYELGFKVYRRVKETAIGYDRRMFKVLDYILDEGPYRTSMSWERVDTAFTKYFDVEDEEPKEEKSRNYSSYYQCQPKQDDLRTKYLKVLGISVEISKNEIKTVYRKLVLKYHPDKGGSPEKFRQIQEAYEYLINN